jgi:hypothetical protein
MDVESSYLGALATVRRWRIVGRELELLDAKGTRVLVFEPAT